VQSKYCTGEMAPSRARYNASRRGNIASLRADYHFYMKGRSGSAYYFAEREISEPFLLFSLK
jgi:hypothetical protein